MCARWHGLPGGGGPTVQQSNSSRVGGPTVGPRRKSTQRDTRGGRMAGMTSTPKAVIPTRYAGCHFRSRLEARWAVREAQWYDLWMGKDYNRVHYRARKNLDDRCSRCGDTERLQAALRADIPAARLLTDPDHGCLFSEDVADYFTLCLACHKHMDGVELRTHCRSGHAYTPENTSVRPDGSRRCLACHREQEAVRLSDPEARRRKQELDRQRRKPLTKQQRARKSALQRFRRRETRFERGESPR